MVEKIVQDYLREALDVPVWMEEPSGDKPRRYVILEKTSGGEDEYIQSAVMAIQSNAESLYQAAVLNELVKNAMRDIIQLPEISKCKLSNDYNYTNTAKQQYRYQAVYDLVVLE
jgi:hypothetical protein